MLHSIVEKTMEAMMMIGTVTICVLIWLEIFVPVSSNTRKLTVSTP